MKLSPIFLVLVLLTILQCSNENTQNDDRSTSKEKYPQNWTLFKMTGRFSNMETYGENMEWQEFYHFREDSTFVKTRLENGNTISASGNFTYNEKEKAFTLYYKDDSSIIGNCSSQKSEHLVIDTHEDVLVSSWHACDGPGLYYRKNITKENN